MRFILNKGLKSERMVEADAGGYVFATRDTGSSSPLWGLRVIERIGAGTEAPYLITWNPLQAEQLASGEQVWRMYFPPWHARADKSIDEHREGTITCPLCSWAASR